MSADPISPARERVLQVAEQLFSERGYTAVTLRDIADALHMRQASLYNHAPGGKEELFVAVTERGLLRHYQGIMQAAATAQDLHGQLRAVARWLLAHPPLNLSRMRDSDMPALSPEHATQLSELAYKSVLEPIEHLVDAAAAQGQIHPSDGLLTGVFLTAMDAVRAAAFYRHQPVETVADELIELLLDGARPR